MTLWCYCPNEACDAPPMSQDAPFYAIPGNKCYWCGSPILAMPDEAYDDDGAGEAQEGSRG